jgi:hypothetical protein
MKSIYYEQGDVLRLRISTELVVREISQGDIHICYAAEGSIAELVIQNAGQHGIFEPEIKLAWPKKLLEPHERHLGK